jgi:mono/diheme cytochrome c family protein
MSSGRAIAAGLGAVLVLAGATGRAQSPVETGDPKRGFAYTQVHCAGCHGVNNRQPDRPPTMGIATFEEIANAPGMSALALAVWFQSPHKDMPNLILAPPDRDDVIAYIVSLKQPK